MSYIWRAETIMGTARAFEGFVKPYDVKYPKATACLQKDREELLMFYAFQPPIGQVCAPRIPSNRRLGPFGIGQPAREDVSREMLHMMFKLGQCAEKRRRRLRGFKELPKVVAGIRFPDGMEESTTDPVAV